MMAVSSVSMPFSTNCRSPVSTGCFWNNLCHAEVLPDASSLRPGATCGCAAHVLQLRIGYKSPRWIPAGEGPPAFE